MASEEASSPSEVKAEAPRLPWRPSHRPNDHPLEIRMNELLERLVIAHEVAINQGFVFGKEPPDNSIQKQVTEVVHNAFWDVIEEKLSKDPPDLTVAVSLLKEVKEGLFSVMLPHHEKLRNEVDVTLDLELIEQQVSHGAVDIMYFANFILSVMKKLCAPIRDENISKLTNETNIVALFRGILDTIKLMKIDIANFALSTFKPELLNNHMEYERKRFGEYLELLEDLPLTEAWLKEHVKPQAIHNFRHFLYEAFMDFLTWDESRRRPETLILDYSRYIQVKVDFYRIVNVCTIVLLSFYAIPPELLSDVSLKNTLKQNVFTLLENVGNDQKLEEILPNVLEQLKKDINERLSEEGMEALTENQVKSLGLQVKAVLEPDNRVKMLVTARIKDYILEILKEPQESVTFPPGLVLFRNEIDSLCNTFINLILYNINICIEQYKKLLNYNGTSPNDF